MGEQEQYIITTATSPTVIQGKFFDLIHRKHVDAYGQQGADNIVKNVRSTYCYYFTIVSKFIKYLNDVTH